ncbi:MAG: hypothetical protein HC905_00085 [Bacteroidales bacterium]|nr:hypothetical protein [Bacteroidales bacterium]
MMKLFKNFAPHLLAVLVFIVVTFLYFPPLLEGKVIRQGDIMQFIGMSKEIKDFREKTGQEALWTNSMFGGMPAYQISVVYHNNVAKKINNVLSLKFPVPAVYLFLSLLGFYILMLVFGANIWIAVAGAIGFAFSSYFFIIGAAGHNSKAHVMAFMAPILAGVILTFRGKYILGAAIFAIFLALQLNANHLQITYYTAMIILVYGLTELVYSLREKRIMQFTRAGAILAVVAIIAACTNFTNMLLTYEYGQESTRGKSELTTEAHDKTSGLDKSYILNDYSYGIDETFNLFIPNFKGGGNSDVGTDSESYEWLRANNVPNAQQIVKHMPTYWGTQRFTAGPVYIGAVIIFLFVLGLFILRGAFKWWIVAVTVLSILLAWGKNMEWFSTLFINYFPGYNKFRTVSMILVIAELTIPLLAMVTFIRILNKDFDKQKLSKSLLMTLYITGGFALLFALLPGLFYNFTSPNDIKLGWPEALVNALISDRESLLRADAFRSLLFVLMTAGLIWLIMKEKIKVVWASVILAALFLFDLGIAGKRYLNEDNFVTKRESNQPYQPSEADMMILQDKDLSYRVYNLTVDPFNDASTSYFHKSIGGYHGAKLKRYQELIEQHLGKQNIEVLNMLNTRYVIVPGENQQPVAQMNPGALGNAWFIDSVQIVPNADVEIAALSDFNPETKVIIDQRFKSLVPKMNFTNDSLSDIKLTDYQPNYLVYQSKTTSDQLAVFRRYITIKAGMLMWTVSLPLTSEPIMF